MYYMPRFDPNITICGYADGVCVRKIERELQLKRNDSFTCKECYSACSSVHYDSVRHCIWQIFFVCIFFVFGIFVFFSAFLFLQAFSFARIYNKTPYLTMNKLVPRNMSFVHVYYQKPSFRSQQKNELIGFTNFLGWVFFMWIYFSQ